MRICLDLRVNRKANFDKEQQCKYKSINMKNKVSVKWLVQTFELEDRTIVIGGGGIEKN